MDKRVKPKHQIEEEDQPILLCPSCSMNIPYTSLKKKENAIVLLFECACSESVITCELEKYLNSLSELNKVELNNCFNHQEEKAVKYCAVCQAYIGKCCLNKHNYEANHLLRYKKLIIDCNKHHRCFNVYCLDCHEVICQKCQLNHLPHKRLTAIFDDKQSFEAKDSSIQSLLSLNQKHKENFLSALSEIKEEAKHIQWRKRIEEAYKANNNINCQLKRLWTLLLETQKILIKHPMYRLLETIKNINFGPPFTSEHSKENMEKWYNSLLKYYENAFIFDVKSEAGRSFCRPNSKTNHMCITTIKQKHISLGTIQLSNEQFVVSSIYEPMIKVYDSKTFKPLQSLSTIEEGKSGDSYPISSLIQLHDGRIVSIHFNKKILVWNLSLPPDRAIVYKFKTRDHQDISSMLQLQDGRLVTSGKGKWIEIWSISTFKCIKSLCLGTAVIQLLDGRLVCTNKQKRFNVYDVNTLERLKTMKVGEEEITELIQLYDGRLVSGSSESAVIQFWDITSYPFKCLNTVKAYADHKYEEASDYVFVLRQLADGRLASGGDNKVIQIWDVNSFECVLSFETESNHIVSLIALDNGMLASMSTNPYDYYASVTADLQIWTVS